jgi:hypothetical protein
MLNRCFRRARIPENASTQQCSVSVIAQEEGERNTEESIEPYQSLVAQDADFRTVTLAMS